MRVIAGQSLSDIAVQEDGTIETVFDWALANNISVTEILKAGTVLVNPNSEHKDTERASYFKGIQKKIATALTNQNYELVVADEGIGAMIIEQTFIVR